MSDEEIDLLQDIPEGTPDLDENRNPPRDADGAIVYPFRYDWNRQCQVHGTVRCTTVVFAFGEISHRGACGHNWDRKGNPLGQWLATDRRYWSKS